MLSKEPEKRPTASQMLEMKFFKKYEKDFDKN